MFQRPLATIGPSYMYEESDRHYLVSPVASGLARLFLMEQTIESAKKNDISPQLKSELQKQLIFLQEKLVETQHRIDAKLAASRGSQDSEKA